MDLETPVDAWYVYVAVALVGTTLVGLVFAFPTTPPPDAERAAGAIEGTTASEYPTTASYDHDADVVTVDRRTITMENAGGRSHAAFAYGVVVPVDGEKRLENLAHGASFEEEYATELADGEEHAVAAFERELAEAFEENTGEELRADGELQARQLAVDTEIDGLDPLEERLTVRISDDWEPVVNELPDEIWDPEPYVGEVSVSYVGVGHRHVEIQMDGEYRLADLLPGIVPDELAPDAEPLAETERLTATPDGAGGAVLEPRSDGRIDHEIPGTDYRLESSQPPRDPIEFTVTLTDPAGELPTERWEFELEHADGEHRWENEIDREIEFDHDHPAVEIDERGYYRVTLVVV